MKSNSKKIFSLILLIGVVLILAWLSLFLKSEGERPFEKILIRGNILLSTSEYLRFLHLDNKDSYTFLNSKIVRDRFQKHPYVDFVQVEQFGNELKVEIGEKEISAILALDSLQLLVTENSQLVPYLDNTKAVNCPLILNPKLNNEINVMKSCLNQADIVDALKIVDVIKSNNEKFYSSISEIDLRNGKDILVTIEGMDYPIIIGRKNLVKKAFYLSSSLEYLINKPLSRLIKYVDFRFNNLAVFGFNDSLFVSKENRI